MADPIISSGGVTLAAPTKITIDDEIIWSSDTGRTLTALFVGDIVATKKKLGVTWEYIREQDLLTIEKKLIAGFFPVTFRDGGKQVTIDAYRGTLSKEVLGDIGDGYYWYRSVTVSIIQR